MTRKRFMKLLMGEGISRNNAAKLITTYRAGGFPYVVAFADHQLGLHSVALKEHIGAVSEVLEGIKETAGKVCRSFGEMTDALLELGKQMKEEMQ